MVYLSRIYTKTGDAGDTGLGALRLGAGFSIAHIAVDYTYQNLDFFGATQRVGVRFATSLSQTILRHHAPTAASNPPHPRPGVH